MTRNEIAKATKEASTKTMDRTAKFIAHLTLIATAAYGMRTLLQSIDETFAYVITGLFVLSLSYIAYR